MLDGGFFHGYAMIGLIIATVFLVASIIQSIVWYKIFKKKIVFFVSLIILVGLFLVFDLDIAISINIISIIISIAILIFKKNKINKNEKK